MVFISPVMQAHLDNESLSASIKCDNLVWNTSNEVFDTEYITR